VESILGVVERRRATVPRPLRRLITRMLLRGMFGLTFTGPATAAELPTSGCGSRFRRLLPDDRVNAPSRSLRRPLECALLQAGVVDQFAKDGSVRERSGGRRGQGASGGRDRLKITVRARDTVEIPFAFAWYMPHHQTLAARTTSLLSACVVDSADVAKQLLSNWRPLLALTEEWQQKLTSSNLPVWLARRSSTRRRAQLEHDSHVDDVLPARRSAETRWRTA